MKTRLSGDVFHIRPQPTDGRGLPDPIARVEQWLGSANLRIDHGGDVYRALARIALADPDTLAAIVVCVDVLTEDELPFFALVSTIHQTVPVYVYGRDHDEDRVKRAIAAGATGPLTEKIVDSIAASVHAKQPVSEPPPSVADDIGSPVAETRDSSTDIAPPTPHSIDDRNQQPQSMNTEAVAEIKSEAESKNETAANVTTEVNTESVVNTKNLDHGEAADETTGADESLGFAADSALQAGHEDDRGGSASGQETEEGVKQDEAKDESESENKKGEEEPAGRARVPWLRYHDLPERTGPGRTPPAGPTAGPASPTPPSAPRDHKATPARDPQPLLSEDELRALIGDDVGLPSHHSQSTLDADDETSAGDRS